MAISDDVNNILSGGGAYFGFDGPPPITIVGEVLAAEAGQQTDPSGKLKTFDNGDPMPQIVITLQTELRESDDDEGVRRIYAKSGMLTAIREALRASGSKLAEGGRLAVQYHGVGEASQKGWNPPKLYKAQYKPPSAMAQANDLLGATAAPAEPATDLLGDEEPF